MFSVTGGAEDRDWELLIVDADDVVEELEREKKSRVALAQLRL